MNDITKTPDEWLKEYNGLAIMDPDGWDRSDFERSWSEPITRTEFERRTAMSTCHYPKWMISEWTKTCSET